MGCNIELCGTQSMKYKGLFAIQATVTLWGDLWAMRTVEAWFLIEKRLRSVASTYFCWIIRFNVYLGENLKKHASYKVTKDNILARRSGKWWGIPIA